ASIFKGGKEEGFVPSNRPAGAYGEVIVDAERNRVGEKVSSIERGAVVIVIGTAMELVGTRLVCCCEGDGTLELRRRVGQDVGNLGDAIDVRGNRTSAHAIRIGHLHNA